MLLFTRQCIAEMRHIQCACVLNNQNVGRAVRYFPWTSNQLFHTLKCTMKMASIFLFSLMNCICWCSVQWMLGALHSTIVKRIDDMKYCVFVYFEWTKCWWNGFFYLQNVSKFFTYSAVYNENADKVSIFCLMTNEKGALRFILLQHSVHKNI